MRDGQQCLQILGSLRELMITTTFPLCFVHLDHIPRFNKEPIAWPVDQTLIVDSTQIQGSESVFKCVFLMTLLSL